MKIVHVSSVHEWRDTRIFYRMCRGLVRRGHDVVLVAGGAPGGEEEGVQTVTLPRVKSRLIRMIFVAPFAIAKASKLGADVVHLHDPELLPWGAILRWSGHRVVFDMHEFLPGAIRSKGWLSPWLRKSVEGLWRLVERLLLRGTPTIFAERSYLEHYPWIRVSETVLNLPDAEELLSRPMGPHGMRRVIYVGRIAEERGSIVTLEALRILKEQGRPVGFLCIGAASDEHRSELEHRISHYDLPEVEFTGFLPQPAAIERMRGGSIGLAVLKRTPNYEKSYPTKMFEYMALGLPVITSNFELYRGVISGAGCGICVDPDSPEEIAAAIDMLLSDRPRMLTLAANGRTAVADRYSWRGELDKLEQFYRNIAP